MFRHKTNQSEVISIPDKITKEKSEIKSDAELSNADLRDLMEKNLKWSQIIYEQNRKINRKLAWTAVAGWLRLFLIVAPLLVALWFLPSLIQKVSEMYGLVLNPGAVSSPSANNNQSLEQILKLLPLDSAQQQQIKTILK